MASWICQAKLKSDDHLVPNRIHDSQQLSTQQYARIVENWVKSMGLDPVAYGTHTLREALLSSEYRLTFFMKGKNALFVVISLIDMTSDGFLSPVLSPYLTGTRNNGVSRNSLVIGMMVTEGCSENKSD